MSLLRNERLLYTSSTSCKEKGILQIRYRLSKQLDFFYSQPRNHQPSISIDWWQLNQIVPITGLGIYLKFLNKMGKQLAWKCPNSLLCLIFKEQSLYHTHIMHASSKHQSKQSFKSSSTYMLSTKLKTIIDVKVCKAYLSSTHSVSVPFMLNRSATHSFSHCRTFHMQ